MKDHETIDITPKDTISVDVGIAPVVGWLNSFHSIITEWSCEGDWKKDGRAKNNGKSGAYVLFYCRNLSELAQICLTLQPSFHFRSVGKIEVQMYEGSLRYDLRIEYKEDLEELIERIS